MYKVSRKAMEDMCVKASSLSLSNVGLLFRGFMSLVNLNVFSTIVIYASELSPSDFHFDFCLMAALAKTMFVMHPKLIFTVSPVPP